MKAKHIQKGKMIDYVNSTGEKINFGDVIVVGSIVAVAAEDIAAGATGSVATEDVYEVEKDASTFAAGAVVYLDADAGKATSTSASNTRMGIAIAAAASAAGSVRVKLNA